MHLLSHLYITSLAGRSLNESHLINGFYKCGLEERRSFRLALVYSNELTFIKSKNMMGLNNSEFNQSGNQALLSS